MQLTHSFIQLMNMSKAKLLKITIKKQNIFDSLIKNNLF
jgi:hypothetical protein